MNLINLFMTTRHIHARFDGIDDFKADILALLITVEPQYQVVCATPLLFQESHHA